MVAVIEYSEKDRALVAKDESGAIIASVVIVDDEHGQVDWVTGITALMGDHSIEMCVPDGERYIVEYV